MQAQTPEIQYTQQTVYRLTYSNCTKVGSDKDVQVLRRGTRKRCRLNG